MTPDAAPAGPVAPPRSPQPARAPRALPPRKAAHAAECQQLEQLPNIGPSLAADLRCLGIGHPQELAQADPWELYQRLCRVRSRRQDPCVLDTFIAATEFMRGQPAQPWWAFTARRKRQYGAI